MMPSYKVQTKGMRCVRGVAAVTEMIICVYDVLGSIEELLNNITNTVHYISTEPHE